MTTPTMIDGPIGRLAVHDLGGEGDTVLVVAHATGFLGPIYRAFAHELNHLVRVVALDFRGHGDSATPESLEDFAWSGMADDLTAVIDHIGASTVHGFGHSMGGAALLEVERRNPGTFASAMVFEPVIPPGPPENPHMADVARVRRPSFATPAEALLRYASKPPLGLFRADVLHDYVSHGFREFEDGITLKCLPSSEANTFQMGGAHITLSVLPEIDLRVVVSVGSDGSLPAQLAPAVAGELPNGRLRNFSTVGHFGPLQDPVSVAMAMIELLDTAN